MGLALASRCASCWGCEGVGQPTTRGASSRTAMRRTAEWGGAVLRVRAGVLFRYFG